MEDAETFSHGWHTLVWLVVGVIAGAVHFRLYHGPGVENEDEEQSAVAGCLIWVADGAAMLLVGVSLIAILNGWPFLGWSWRV